MYEWHSRTRGIKASLATGFLILIGMTVLWVVFELDDFRTANLASEHSIEITLSAAVKNQLAKLWRSQAHFGQAVYTLSGVAPDVVDAGSQTHSGAKKELKHRPRVFDMILLNDELDTLEIRLNELHSVVDVFFILEAGYTFSGRPKPLYFSDNETRFRQFRDKIVHVTIPHLSPDDEKQYVQDGGWANEKFSRNKGFEIAMDARKPNDGDWIILSDLDEIPKRSFLETVKAPDPDTDIGRRLLEGFPESDGDVFKLGCQFYYYSYEYRHRGDWYGPTLMRYRDPDSPIFTRPESDPYPGLDVIQHIMENDWADAGRRLRDRVVGNTPHFDGQCHHCTWCFSNITAVIRKMQSYSHTEHSQSTYTNKKWILDHFSQGIDLFDRGGEIYDYVEDNQDLPQYIRSNSEKFSFMLRRKGLANAGFIDVDPTNPLAE
ncbi:hypothetical protein BGZ67_009915 [Mortierella alpina]|nr:hypothetical protein BGZ67_009915 [Mortierella alpina]